MREVAGLIADAIEKRNDPDAIQQTKERAIALATSFPLPGVLISQGLEPHARVTR
jgi:hypothetical protein